MSGSEVLSKVVQNDLCIGCGICVDECPSNALSIEWNEYGFLVPLLSGSCDSNGKCLKVCPFNPTPDVEVHTENELASLYLDETEKEHPKIGKYMGIYAGYSIYHRNNSSSGGIATYVLSELLNRGIVNHIIAVTESHTTAAHYNYEIISTPEDLLNSSKTKYYPVTLAGTFAQIEKLEGKVAVTGVACFVKGIRLAQHYNPILNEKIKFIAGIICGGVKSSFYTDYLASKIEIEKKNIKQPKYRIKNTESTALDYSFSAFDSSTSIEKSLRMQLVGDMWGTGLFKANACEFCDDVATELADISLGDAWINPYKKDGKGTSIVITRSRQAEQIITEGIECGALKLDPLTSEQFIESQKGGFNHRHSGIGFRVEQARKKGIPVPPKRHLYKTTSLFKVVQILRGKTRSYSLEIWKKYGNATDFDRQLKSWLFILKNFSRLNRYSIKIKSRFKRSLGRLNSIF